MTTPGSAARSAAVTALQSCAAREVWNTRAWAPVGVEESSRGSGPSMATSANGAGGPEGGAGAVHSAGAPAT